MRTWGGLLVGFLALSAPALGQDGADSQAEQSSVDEAYEAFSAALRKLHAAPRAERPALMERVYGLAGSFLDRFAGNASPEQLEKVGGIWLNMASKKDDAEALAKRLRALKELPSLPRSLDRQVRLMDAAERVKVGAPAPDWSLKDIRDGKTVALRDMRGKVVLIEFWASWCSPCLSLMKRRVLPLHAKYGESTGFVIVSIGVQGRDDTPAKQKKIADALKVPWRKLFDDSGLVDATYGARGIPYMCLVDEEGKILAVGDGWEVIDDVERIVGERLGAKESE